MRDLLTFGTPRLSLSLARLVFLSLHPSQTMDTANMRIAELVADTTSEDPSKEGLAVSPCILPAPCFMQEIASSVYAQPIPCPPRGVTFALATGMYSMVVVDYYRGGCKHSGRGMGPGALFPLFGQVGWLILREPSLTDFPTRRSSIPACPAAHWARCVKITVAPPIQWVGDMRRRGRGVGDHIFYSSFLKKKS